MSRIHPQSFVSIAQRSAAALVLFMLIGCASPKAPLQVEAPRKFAGTTGLRPVVVLPFSGRRSEQLRDEFERMLSRTKVGGEPYFTRVESRKLQNASTELTRIFQGEVYRSDLDRVREVTGARGIASGEVVEASVTDSSYRDAKESCGATENTWRGVVLRRCEEGRSEVDEVNCTKRTVRLVLAPKLISVRTGLVAFTDHYTRQTVSTHCSGTLGSLEKPEKMMNKVIAQVMSDIQEDITPEMKRIKVPMKRLSKSADASEAQRAEFDSAIEFANAERLDRACETWRALRRDGLNDVGISYNLALCRESEGDLDGTLATLTETDRMLSRPDSKVNAYLHRIRGRIAARQQMAETYAKLLAEQPAPIAAPEAKRTTGPLARVQERLNQLGYRCGSPDGSLGPQTRKCIYRYQKKHQLKATGRLTSELLVKLGIMAEAQSKASSPARAAR